MFRRERAFERKSVKCTRDTTPWVVWETWSSVLLYIHNDLHMNAGIGINCCPFMCNLFIFTSSDCFKAHTCHHKWNPRFKLKIKTNINQKLIQSERLFTLKINAFVKNTPFWNIKIQLG